MKNNAILFCHVDKEDYWVTSGIVFKVQNTETYEDAYNEIKNQLEHPDIINHIIEQKNLFYTLFAEDKSYKFVYTYWRYGVLFVFENDNEEQVEYRMCYHFVWTA